MQLIHQNRMVELSESNLLGMIRNNKVHRLVRAVCDHYEVANYKDLNTKPKEAILFLAVAALEVRSAEVCEFFDITEKELLEIGKRVDAKAKECELHKNYLYALYTCYMSRPTKAPYVPMLVNVEYRNVVNG